ncbi:uncharacterized protein LOC100872598 isoform X1 [Apis florea]|uniref:uncharacterized protein LOC100872598 isoform X1 n=1 Tax=Apis florea TaxID=7463 RepID=UPI0012FEDEB6|nr:uncharacterized protein LOC100872598 isoform X1 [Apis florea]
MILRFACDNPTTVEYFNDIGGIKQILKYIEDTSHSKLFKQVLDIAVCLSHTSRGRKMLHMYGIVDYLLHTLFGNVQEMYETSCHGIGMMTLYSRAAKDLTTSNCVKTILDVLKNDNLNWSARQAALFALNSLMKCDIKNCEDFLTIQGQNYLLWLMKQTIGKVPVEILVDTVDCLISIARNQVLRDIIINTDIIEAMCASFELTCISMDDFKIACCKALSMMCLEEKGRQEFLKIEGPKRLYNLLCDIKSIPIRNAAAQLIQLLCADPVLANAFVSARFLN